MAMNTNLLVVLKQIVSQHGGLATLSDARRVKAFLADLAGSEPKPQKNALTAAIGQGFPAMLQNVPAGERGAAKATLAERLNREEGLDVALCADTLDLLDAALFGAQMPEQTKVHCQACGKELAAGWVSCPYCGMAAPGTSAPPKSQPVPAPPARQDKEVWSELHTLTGHTAWVWSVAYRPDGRRIVSGSGDDTVRIWGVDGE